MTQTSQKVGRAPRSHPRFERNRISALQLQAKVGIGSYKTAWLLLHKLRKSVVDPDRTLLAGMIEIDESSITFRTRNDPPASGQDRSHDGKIMLIGAVECLEGGQPGRIRLAQIQDYTGETPKGFAEPVTAGRPSPNRVARTAG